MPITLVRMISHSDFVCIKGWHSQVAYVGCETHIRSTVSVTLTTNMGRSLTLHIVTVERGCSTHDEHMVFISDAIDQTMAMNKL